MNLLKISALLTALVIFNPIVFAQEVPVVEGYQDQDRSDDQAPSSYDAREMDSASSRDYSYPRQHSHVNLPTSQRITILERQTANLPQLLNQVTRLQQQIQTLQGQLETQNHELKNLQDQLKSQYQDLDQRIATPGSSKSTNASLSKTTVKSDKKPGAATQGANTEDSDTAASTDEETDSSASTAISTSATSTTSTDKSAKDNSKITTTVDKKNNEVTTTTDNSGDDKSIYQAAFKLLKKKKYDQAATAFQSFIKNYPDSTNIISARYWLGQLYLLQSHPDKAISQFKTILKNSPNDAKIPDVMLQLALAYYAKGDLPHAKSQLKSVQQNYPDSSAAKMAGIRLQQISKASSET